MNPRPVGFLSGIVLAALCLMGSGCAVTRIDVDVYKGSLNNVETIQVQQFGVMAIAAKPILIRLRDQLETSTEHKDFTKRPEYIADFMDYAFENPQATRVNAVLY